MSRETQEEPRPALERAGRISPIAPGIRTMPQGLRPSLEERETMSLEFGAAC